MSNGNKYDKWMIKDFNVQGKLSAMHQLDEYMQAKYFNKTRLLSNKRTGEVIGESTEAPTNKHFLQWMEEDYSVGRGNWKKRNMPFLSTFFQSEKGRKLMSDYESMFLKMKQEGRVKQGIPSYYNISEKDSESLKQRFLDLPDWSPSVSEESRRGTGTKTIEDRIMRQMEIL